MPPDEGDRHSGDTVSPFYIAPDLAGALQRPHVLKHADTFAVIDYFGDMGTGLAAGGGLFFEDTRHLAKLLLTIDGVRPLLLSSTVDENNTILTADLANPDLTLSNGTRIARDTIHILVNTVLGKNGLSQVLKAKNFGRIAAVFALELAFDTDFADIFEVRGATRPKRGRRLPDEKRSDGVDLAYRGLDGVTRRTCLTFLPPPSSQKGRQAVWHVELPPGGEDTIEVRIACAIDGREAAVAEPQAVVVAAAQRWMANRRSGIANVYTSNERFNDWLNRSRADVDMLVTDTTHGPYAYAGIPWFSTAFGRDGIVTALECLWLDPTLAAGTLSFLAANQATEMNPKADAEPGKILHETRKGEMANLGEVPFARYYGSVDATPLFVVLAAAYHRRTGDIDLVSALWPNIEAALAWMGTYGDPDGDGFIEYDRKSVNGLINQGWKDSGDSIFHADGTLAEAPIALAEVQAYAYAAYRGAASLALALGNPKRSDELNNAANRLRDQFEYAFWIEELGTYALALDGGKQPCRVRTSNAGQVLFGGLASPERAATVAATLTESASFSNWGIRTVAETEALYNPLSYHNGSIWPHDNALIAMGFGRYRLKEPLLKVLTALFDATLFLDLNRLPELFCGFVRRPGVGPTAYPVACIPQAWSSASVFAMLGAALGISFEPEAGRICFDQPILPPWLSECTLTNLRLGSGSVDLVLRRTQDDVTIHVQRRDGPIEVTVTI